MENPANLFGVDCNGDRGLLGPVHHGGNHAGNAQTAGMILVEFPLAGSCGHYFRSAHRFLVSLRARRC